LKEGSWVHGDAGEETVHLNDRENARFESMSSQLFAIAPYVSPTSKTRVIPSCFRKRMRRARV
jgi:hypothetical protein